MDAAAKPVFFKTPSIPCPLWHKGCMARLAWETNNLSWKKQQTLKSALEYKPDLKKRDDAIEELEQKILNSDPRSGLILAESAFCKKRHHRTFIELFSRQLLVNKSNSAVIQLIDDLNGKIPEKISPFTWNFYLISMINQGNCQPAAEKAMELHERTKHPYSLAVHVTALIMQGESDKASYILKHNQGNKFHTMVASILGNYLSQPEKALCLLEALGEKDAPALALFIKLLENSGSPEKAQAVFKSMPAELRKDYHVVLAAASALQKSGKYHEALSLLDDLPRTEKVITATNSIRNEMPWDSFHASVVPPIPHIEEAGQSKKKGITRIWWLMKIFTRSG